MSKEESLEEKMNYITRSITIEDYDSILKLWNSAEQTRRAMNPVDDTREGIDRYLQQL